MVICGYDTDDLTDRQNYIFHKMKKNRDGIPLIAVDFVRYSVRKNFRLQKFDNYEGDCDFLDTFDAADLKAKYGIDMSTLYK